MKCDRCLYCKMPFVKYRDNHLFCSRNCWTKYHYKYNKDFNKKVRENAKNYFKKKYKNDEEFRKRKRIIFDRWRKENREHFNEGRRKYIKIRKDRGICYRCGKKIDDKKYTRCLECRIKEKK